MQTADSLELGLDISSKWWYTVANTMTSKLSSKWLLVQCWICLLPLFSLLFYWFFVWFGFGFLFLILFSFKHGTAVQHGWDICRYSCLIPGAVWWHPHPTGFRLACLSAWQFSLGIQQKLNCVSTLSTGLGISLQCSQVLSSPAFKFSTLAKDQVCTFWSVLS